MSKQKINCDVLVGYAWCRSSYAAIPSVLPTRQLLDAYKQATGTAGNYQVSDAKKIATLNIGGTATTNVCFIIGK